MKLRSSHNQSRPSTAVFAILLPLVLGLALIPGSSAQAADRSPVLTYEFDEASGTAAPAGATGAAASAAGSGKNPVVSYGGKNPAAPPMPYGKTPVGKQLIPPPGDPMIKFHFGLDTTVYYDDNIFISNNWEVDDVIFRIVPHVGIDLGDADGRVDTYGILRYSPVFNIYLDNEGENTMDHDASFEGMLRMRRLALLAYSRYQRLRDAQPDAGFRYDEDVFTNALRAIYDVSPKTNLEVGAKNVITDHGGDPTLIDSNEWIFDIVGEYVVSDKTRVGLGYAYGILDVDDARMEQTFHRPFGRLNWYPSGKLSLDALAGVDFRDLEIGDRETFVYDVSLQYNPRAGTAMHFTTYRDIEPSVFFENQNFESTGVGFKIDQRVGKRWYAGFETGYEWADYYAVAVPAGLPRNDEYWWVRPSLTYAFRDWLNVVFWYRHRENDSTLLPFDYENNQYGISLNMVF